MDKITRVGVDLAMNVLQIHAVDVSGKVVSNRPDLAPENRRLHLTLGCLSPMQYEERWHAVQRKKAA